MGVTFAYRCHYGNPSEKLIRRFEADASVLAWFQNRWDRLTAPGADVYEMLKAELGQVPGNFRLFEWAAEQKTPKPTSMAKLRAAIGESCYVVAIAPSKANVLQVSTDDDELSMAWYFFDDTFVAKRPGVADFLLHADWKLPAQVTVEAGDETLWESNQDEGGLVAQAGIGATWFVFLTFYDSANFDLRGARRLDGARVRDVARRLVYSIGDQEVLALQGAILADEPGLDARERKFLAGLRKTPSDMDLWQVYGDWLEDSGRRVSHVLLERAFRRAARVNLMESELHELLRKSLRNGWSLEKANDVMDKAPRREQGFDAPRVQMSEHLAQVAFQVADWGTPEAPQKLYHQWILFDDVWAASHPELAEGMLRFASRWDVLT